MTPVRPPVRHAGPIRVGIVGVSPDPANSWATRAHVPALKSLPDYELAAVCTSAPETARATADHFGVPLAFSDPAALAAHPDVDLVVVAVRAPLHRQVIEAVLPAGKAVFCEWPLGASTEQAIEILAMTEAAGVASLIGLQGSCNEALNYIRELVAEGFVGRMTAVTLHVEQEVFGPTESARSAYLADVRNGANLLTIGGGHALSALAHAVGDFRELSAFVVAQHAAAVVAGAADAAPKTAPDQIVINGVLVNGAVASVHLKGGATRTAGVRLEINGTEGDLLATSPGAANLHRAVLRLRGGRGAGLEDMAVPERCRLGRRGLPPGDAVAVAHIYDGYARALREGRPWRLDFRHAVHWHQVLSAVQRASDQRVAQVVDRPDPQGSQRPQA